MTDKDTHSKKGGVADKATGVVNSLLRATDSTKLNELEKDRVETSKMKAKWGEIGQTVPDSQIENMQNKISAEKAELIEDMDLQPTDPNSPEFKEWFGDSKIVNVDGSPKRVYMGRGSGQDIFKFNPKPIDNQAKRSASVDAIFFSSDSDFANEYAQKTNGVVYPTYIKMEKPFVISEELETFKKMHTELTGNTLMNKGRIGVIKSGDWSAIDDYGNAGLKYIKNLGYGGIQEVEDGVTNYAVFEGEQVKSAISNTGE